MTAEHLSFRSNYVSLSDGQQIHVLQGGSGPAMVFVHGLPGLGCDFLPLAKRLATRFRCVLLDRVGYGGSVLHHNSRPMTIEQSVADVQELLDLLELTDVVLIGWSYGSDIVMRVSSTRPDLVNALVLLGPPGPTLNWPLDTLDKLLFYSGFGAMLLKGATRLVPGVIRSGLSQAVGREVSDELFEIFMSSLNQPGTIENWLGEGRNWQPSTMHPEAVNHRCLILHGEQDARIPIAVARELGERIPAARFCAVSDAGHWPFLTHSQLVEEEIVSFVNSAPERASGNCV